MSNSSVPGTVDISPGSVVVPSNEDLLDVVDVVDVVVDVVVELVCEIV